MTEPMTQEPIRFQEALADQHLSIFITKDTVHMYSHNVDTADLPRVIAEKERDVELYKTIYAAWKKKFGGK